MPKDRRTTEQLLELYRLSQEGLETQQIAEHTGISQANVTGALYHLGRYLDFPLELLILLTQ